MKKTNIKYKILIILSFLIINSSLLISQDTWVRSYAPWGNSQFDSYFVDDVVACMDGGFALNGTHVWYDGSNFEMNPYNIKTDSEGNIEWAERETHLPFISCSHTLVELDDGSFITSGYETPPSSSYLLKRNAEGDTLWTMSFYTFTIRSMQQTDDGNLILSGMDQVTDLPAIRKITPEGETIWTQDFLMGPEGTTGDHSGYIFSVTQTSDDGYVGIGSVIGMEVWNYDFFLLKTNSIGDSLWSVRIPDDELIGFWAFCMIQDSENNLVFDYYKSWTYATVITKATSEGEINWVQEYSTNDYSYSIIESEDNNYIFYGNTIIKKTPENELIWERELQGFCNIDGDRDFTDGERSIKKIVGGYICVRNIDGIIGLLKLNSDGEVVAADEITIPKPMNSITCYPNPFNPSTTISFNASREDVENTLDISIEIYNVKGQKIKKLETINIRSGINEIVWDGTDESNNPVTSGVYLISLKYKEDVIATKALLLK